MSITNAKVLPVFWHFGMRNKCSRESMVPFFFVFQIIFPEGRAENG